MKTGKTGYFKDGLLCLCILIFALMCFTSCNHTYDTMIQEYNRAFQETASSADTPQPGDPDFREQNMLLEKYTVNETATLNLAAPHNCTSYQWSLFEVLETSGVNNIYEQIKVMNVRLSNGTTNFTREFVCYIPTSNLKVDTYKLKLEVQGKDGVTYRDECLVVIHRNVQ